MKGLKPFIIALSALCVGCGASEGDSTTADKGVAAPASTSTTTTQEAKNMVDTMHLRLRNFNKQINCNGKLHAVAVSNLNFLRAGALQEIRVSNGSYVKEGELMAVTDTYDAEFDVKRYTREIEVRYVELLDDLISLGYSQDTTAVPAHILQRAKNTSGYYTAIDQLESAKRRLRECYLYAPFSGRVANIEDKLHEQSNLFCTLIDDSYFDVEFNILEAEIAMSKVGESVIVFPFIDENSRFRGKITEINPVVDERGQVKVRAKIKNRDGYLVEGMNVRVILENRQPNMFVVPKDAVVLRDGVYVAFRLEDGMALWTYVDVLHSNLDSYAIEGSKKKRTTLREGDIIITSGNLNLSDGTPVVARPAKITPQQQKALEAAKKKEAAQKRAASQKKAAAQKKAAEQKKVAAQKNPVADSIKKAKRKAANAKKRANQTTAKEATPQKK